MRIDIGMAGLLSTIRRFFQRPSLQAPYAQVAKTYTQLRHQILDVQAEQLGEWAGENVWSVLMETGYPDDVVTLFAGVDGTASLYFSRGGGIIGAGKDDDVRTAALAFLREAEQFLDRMQRVDSASLPGPGYTRFHVRTPPGIRMAEAREDDLANNVDTLSPLFYAGHELISKIRVLEEKRRTRDNPGMQ